MQLNFKTFGQGDPIIILHGLFGTLDNWQTIARQLAEQYSVYILDQRNHGRSPHVDAISYPLMAEDLVQFMESQWIYKASIIGHSMGGKTAMQFACDNPDMVEKLIVVDIAPKTYAGNHELIFDALLSLDMDGLTSRKQADELLEQKVTDFGV
ncbi:MAG: alpha/beta fold hydrolase, partial [Bacteroidota bacterium]